MNIQRIAKPEEVIEFLKGKLAETEQHGDVVLLDKLFDASSQEDYEAMNTIEAELVADLEALRRVIQLLGGELV